MGYDGSWTVAMRAIVSSRAKARQVQWRAVTESCLQKDKRTCHRAMVGQKRGWSESRQRGSEDGAAVRCAAGSTSLLGTDGDVGSTRSWQLLMERFTAMQDAGWAAHGKSSA